MAARTSEDIVSPQELEAAFRGTDFGGVDHRELLHASVLKKAVGYHCGYTITCIMRELRLIGAHGAVLQRGRDLLHTYKDLNTLLIRSG